MTWDAEYQGARFYKCALQVNAYKYRAQYRGDALIPEQDYNKQILAQCQRHDIQVLGIADHGWAQETEELRQFLSENGIVVFPGFELPSSEKIHMVCLYPEDTTSEKISQYYGQLKGSSLADGNGTTPSSFSCEQIAKQVLNEQHGFWYAAHMTNKNGLLKLSRAGDNYVHLWKKHDLVMAGHIPSLADNLPKEYKQIIGNTNPDYRREKPIAVINAKDVGKPEDMGDAAASCLIKMTEPTFRAFMQAFFDPESRIRLNAQTPEHPYSAIRAIQWRGASFFGDDRLVFSENLNAVIGGRGTGKSTLIESIRYALDLDIQQDREKAINSIRKRNLSNSEISLTVYSKAQHGQTYTITRRYGEQPVVKNEQGEKSNLEPHDILPEIKILGQNEILDIKDDEEAKLALIRHFFSPENERADREIGELRARLVRNRSKMLEAEEAFEELQAQISQEPSLKEKAKRYEQLGLSDKLKNVQKLTTENSLTNRMEYQFDRVGGWLADYKEVFDLSFLRRLDELDLSNRELLAEMKQTLDALKTSMDKQAQSMEAELGHARSQYEAKKSKWVEACSMLRNKLQEAMAQLPDQMGISGKKLGAEYQDVLRDLAGLDSIKVRHQRQERILQKCKEDRERLVEQYRDIAFARFNETQKTVEKLNRELAGTVKVEVQRMGNAEEFREFLLELEGIGHSKVEWLSEVGDQLDLMQLADWVEQRNADAIIEKYAPFGLSRGTVDKLTRLDLDARLRLQEIELKDTVEIRLNVAHEDADEFYEPLEDLSTGQQCTAILNLLLLNRDGPLIIDQPEDQLDNAFIAERIIRDVRKHKSKRQFLFATHNANVPVLGDAELIAVLSGSSDKGTLKHVGSIDKQDVCEQVASILEGGKAAFDMRKLKYGY